MAEQRNVPEDLREQYLKYRVNIRVLGVVRQTDSGLVFAPSLRRLPHVGSWVAFPSDEVLRQLAGHYQEGAELGFFALGEFIYAGDDPRIEWKPWMRPVSPAVITRFPVDSLVARRTFVFARAGFGKSNLTKLLFSNLYRETPTVTKRGGRRVPVGTIIFDRDGEYFWPDDKNRPGLCDVPHLEDKVVVFTRKQGPSEFYQSFVASDIKLDIRRLSPSAVISIALSPEKQDQQNVRKLKGLSWDGWERLVNLIDEHGNQAPLEEIKEILHLDNNADYEAIAAWSNMTTIVRMLHDRRSRMLDMLITALRAGKLCIVDISQLSGEAALVLTGLILQRIFDINQEEFTKRDPQTIPTIAVLEEAQSVLGQGNTGGTGPYIAWVKEGRKYDLGAMLITQQPGSIPVEILSQGDNWFVFHLLSEADLQAVRRANARYSKDLLASLLNEPIPGHCVFWSSVKGTPYPLPLRIISFEHMYKVRDPQFNLPPAQTYAALLREQMEAELRQAQVAASADATAAVDLALPDDEPDEDEPEGPDVDPLETFRQQAIAALRNDPNFHKEMAASGLPWGGGQTPSPGTFSPGIWPMQTTRLTSWSVGR